LLEDGRQLSRYSVSKAVEVTLTIDGKREEGRKKNLQRNNRPFNTGQVARLAQKLHVGNKPPSQLLFTWWRFFVASETEETTIIMTKTSCILHYRGENCSPHV